MYFVYIIYSVQKNKYYIGSCEDPIKRLVKHNTNHAGFTGGVLDWELKWTELHENRANALQREKQIKKWKSRIMIEKLIQSSVGSMHPDL